MVTPPVIIQQETPQTLQQKADSSAAWLAANRPDLVSRPSVSAEEAARINQAYMQNTLPVLPKYAAPPAGSPGTEQDLTRVYIGGDANTVGTPMDLTRSEYIARFGRTPEAAEAAKHEEHFHPAEFFGTNMAALQGMTLGQIASRYGTRVADYVQDYSREHPSARFQAITAAYEAQQRNVIGSGGVMYQQAPSAKNPYDPNSAAGIAWEINRTGGTVGKTLGEKSYAEGYNPLVNFSAIERATVPTRLTGSGMIAGMASTAEMQAGTVPVFMAIGGYQGVEIPSAKLAVDYATGEFGVYAKAPGHSVYNLIGGGGRAAAQSGMFSVGESLWSKERTFQLGDIGRMEPVSREYQATHSKAGAEAYGGYSTVLTGKLLEPTSKVSRFENLGNLANYVQQIPAGKAEEPGAKIPWSLPSGAPVAQYMDETGLLGVPVKIPVRLADSASEPPQPFIFTSKAAEQSTTIRPQQIQASAGGALRESGIIDKAAGFLSGVSAKADELLRTDIYSGKVLTPEEQSVATKSAVKDFGFTGGIIGQTLWGEKSPEVVKGFFGSVGDFAVGVATLGQWQPFKEKMQQRDAGQQEYLKQKAELESGISLPESYKTDVNKYETTKAAYDKRLSEYTTRATAYQMSSAKTEAEYTSLMSEKSALDKEGAKPDLMYTGIQRQNIGIEQKNKAYDEFIKSGVASGYLKYSGGQLVEDTSKTYDYGEYSKAGASLGGTFRNLMGFSESQLEAYGTTIENKPITLGPWYDPLSSVREKIVYGTGKVVSTHPEKIATAYGGGGVLVVGGGIIGGALEAAGAGTGAAATVARGTLAGGKYILPVVFTGAMGYSVTEGGKASAGKTLINVGEMFPEAAGAALGGGSAYALSGIRLPIGFQTKKTEYAKGYEPIIIDLSGKYPKAAVGAPKGTVEYPSNLPSDLRIPEGEPLIKIGGTRIGKEGVGKAVTIERVPAGVEPDYAAVPATSDIVMSEAMLNIGSEKIFARGSGGGVVSAVSYKSGPGGIFVKAIGSVEKGTGAGSALIGELKGIARERGISKISGEATTESMGFWEKQGAVIRTEPGKSLHPFDIDVGTSTPLSGAEMGSVSESTQLGFLELGKSKTSAAYSIDQIIADYNRYSQKPSAPTTLLREKQASLWQPPTATGILPMDLLPGVGRKGGVPLTEMSWGLGEPLRPLPGEVTLEFAPKGIGKSTERGLTISGAGMSQQMLEGVVTKGSVKAPSGYLSNIDVLISKGTAISRVKPAVEAAKQQKIVLSATGKTFEKSATIGAQDFENVLFGILESEKRPSAKTPPKRIPTGIQMDLLRDALKKKTATIEVSGGAKARKSIQSPVSGKAKKPSQKTIPVISGRVPVQPTGKTKAPVTTTTPVQKPVNIFKPGQKPLQKPQQKQSPYVAPVPKGKTTSQQASVQSPTPPTSQKQTPYVPPGVPQKPGSTPKEPEKPQKQTPYVPPIKIGDPFKTPSKPGPSEPAKPVPPTPVIPPVPAFRLDWPGGGGGAGGGYRKGSRAYIELLGFEYNKRVNPFKKSKIPKKNVWGRI